MKKLEIKAVELDLKQHKRSIPEETLLEAKRLYMAFKPISQIARDLEVNRTTIQYYVRKGWKDERDLASSEFISSMASRRAGDLEGIEKNSIKVLARCINHLAKREIPPSTKEGLDALKILQGIDELAKANPEDYQAFTGDADDEIIDMEVVDPFSAIGEEDDEETIN